MLSGSLNVREFTTCRGVVDRTSVIGWPMSAIDPKRTLQCHL